MLNYRLAYLDKHLKSFKPEWLNKNPQCEQFI